MKKSSTNEMPLFPKKKFKITGLLNNDLEVINEFQEQLSSCKSYEDYTEDDAELFDILKSVAEISVPTDSNDFWGNIKSIESYIDDVISEVGHWNMNGTTLSSLVHDGYFEYYKELLDQNVETVLYNLVVHYLNKLLSKQTDQVILAIHSNREKIEEDLKNTVDLLEDKLNNFFNTNILYNVAEEIIESTIAELDECHKS